ncbi:MAG: aminotransferase class I/II-fold pyridoxal phosphate-dependent enzyme [Cytophagales bacterium]|nr:aminotransferase class I/II-fold pyridoxal phosphate-dependent enzyme [Cytophaga sp.]
MKNATMNLINEIVISSKARGIAQLITEDTQYDGRIITILGKKLINFSSCSYLGLEVDERLKRGAIQSIEKYGVQFSSSRSYVACSLYTELEELVSQIFDGHVVLSTSVSLGHHGVIPVIIGENDAIIMDQQVHSSVQDAVQKVQATGIKVTISSHNDMVSLEKKVLELSAVYDKVWLMIDGVYSMYGDFAPTESLFRLLQTYNKLHIYADDAHGMSWQGKHGRGYILNQTDIHSRIVLATSLNKAFAAGGGAFVFSDKKLSEKVRNIGGSFMFSGPHQIPVLGASIASAKIHLSDEIYDRQFALAERIQYCQDLLEKFGLPVVSNNLSPIFFIGLGLLRVGHNVIQRIMNDGFMVNLAAFPAVPENCTGIRFTITLHHSRKDIEKLVMSIAYNFNEALKEEGRTMEDINKSFRKMLRNKEVSKTV